MAVPADELEVRWGVAAAFADRGAVMYLEAFDAAAVDADAVALVDLAADLTAWSGRTMRFSTTAR